VQSRSNRPIDRFRRQSDPPARYCTTALLRVSAATCEGPYSIVRRHNRFGASEWFRLEGMPHNVDHVLARSQSMPSTRCLHQFSTITFRQTAPTAMRLAIILACVAVICALPIYVFGLVNTINAVESFRALFSGVPGGRYVGAAIVVLIFFPPALILVRYSSPKNEVVFGETALTIKARRELKSIAYAEIGSMVLRQFMSRRLELYDNTGLLLHCFETGMDEAVPSLIVRQIADRIAFDARNERRVVRYVRR
jgi:hypothetical protein